jgi:hypothetical protein
MLEHEAPIPQGVCAMCDHKNLLDEVQTVHYPFAPFAVCIRCERRWDDVATLFLMLKKKLPDVDPETLIGIFVARVTS